MERKHTLKLRRAMEQRPSQELLWELQQEKALLQARVRGLEASVQVGPRGAGRRGGRGGAGPGLPAPLSCRRLPSHPQEGKPDRSSPYVQVLEEDWRQAQRGLQEQTAAIFSLRKDLRQAEALRARVRGRRVGACALGRLSGAPRPSFPLPGGEGQPSAPPGACAARARRGPASVWSSGPAGPQAVR